MTNSQFARLVQLMELIVQTLKEVPPTRPPEPPAFAAPPVDAEV